jgi:hypothetical protein
MPHLSHAELGFNALKRLGRAPETENIVLESLNLDSDELDDWHDLCHSLRLFTAYGISSGLPARLIALAVYAA